MLKKTFMVVAFGTLLAFMPGMMPQNGWHGVQSMAEAKAQPEDIALGGIQVGASMDRVRSIYGEPDRITQASKGGPFGRVITWTYGTSFKIEFDGDTHTVFSATTTANNGIKLPSGIGVGDSINASKWCYDSIKQVSKNQYLVQCNWWMCVAFETNSKGIIRSISIYEIP